jgi:hypothetical protein
MKFAQSKVNETYKTDPAGIKKTDKLKNNYGKKSNI